MSAFRMLQQEDCFLESLASQGYRTGLVSVLTSLSQATLPVGPRETQLTKPALVTSLDFRAG